MWEARQIRGRNAKLSVDSSPTRCFLDFWSRQLWQIVQIGKTQLTEAAGRFSSGTHENPERAAAEDHDPNRKGSFERDSRRRWMFDQC